MEGSALSNACVLLYHDTCPGYIVGYKGAHVTCLCDCHKTKED